MEIDPASFLRRLDDNALVDGFASDSDARQWFQEQFDEGRAEWFAPYVEDPAVPVPGRSDIAASVWSEVLRDITFGDQFDQEILVGCDFAIASDFLWGLSTLGPIGGRTVISMGGSIPRQFYLFAKALAIQTGPKPMPELSLGRYLQATWSSLVLLDQLSTPMSLVTRGIEISFTEAVVSLAERFVVLHELGHLMLGHECGDQDNDQEYAADKFAMTCLEGRLADSGPPSTLGSLALAYATWIACCSAELREATTLVNRQRVELGTRWLHAADSTINRLVASPDGRRPLTMLYRTGRQLFGYMLRPELRHVHLGDDLRPGDRYKPVSQDQLANFHAIENVVAKMDLSVIRCVLELGHYSEQPGSIVVARSSAVVQQCLSDAGVGLRDDVVVSLVAGSRRVVTEILPWLSATDLGTAPRIADIILHWYEDDEKRHLVGPTAVGLVRDPSKIAVLEAINELWRG